MTIPLASPESSDETSTDADPAPSDEELVAALREGDDHAYELLWLRHVAAARRVAIRVAPTQPDDLVSEAFLTIYEQVCVQGKGPTTAFRAYLFAVIRNIASRWYREGTRLVLEPDAEIATEDDGALALEREYDGALLLGAFRALPERWQRVLWLAEVEKVGRPAIAADLGLRANAVSALQRRARKGLRIQWLRYQIPVELRHDPAHGAAELPEAIVAGTAATRPHLARHLSECARCRALDEDLRAAYRDGKRTVTSLGGLAALGVVLPAGSTMLAAPLTAAAAAGVIGATALLLGALGLGLGLNAGILSSFFPRDSGYAQGAPAPDERPPITRDPIPARTPTPTSSSSSTPSAGSPPETDGPPEIDIVFDPTYEGGMPERPSRATPSEPGVVAPPDDGGVDAPPAPTVVSTTPSSPYLAPVLSGVVPAGTEVVASVAGNAYRPAPAADGSWTFDLSSVPLDAGTYSVSIWTITGGVASRAAEMPFTIDPIVLQGFPDYPSVTLRDGMGGGLPFTMTGPPGGAICIDSDTGQSAIVPLDADGHAARVLRFYNYGIYVLRLTPCDGDRYGPDTPRAVSVTEGVFDPWVVDDVRYWELDES